VHTDYDGNGNFDTNVLIENLSPGMAYSVFCVPYSVYGTKSELSTIKRTNTTASTLCCKQLKVSFATSIYEETNYRDFVKLEMDSPPSYDDFAVTVSIVSAEGAQLAVPSLMQPGALYAIDTPLKSSLKAGVAGNYAVEVTFAGVEAGVWEAVYATGTTFTMLSPSLAQPAPSVLGATFADDGASVVVTFSGSTNYGSLQKTFKCALLFSFKETSSGSTVDLPASTKCTWVDDASVKIWTGSDETLSPTTHEVHVVSGNDLTSACEPPGCELWPRVDTSSSDSSDYSAMIANAVAPTTPLVSISAPSSVGSCDDISLDISSSSGSGGRGWLRVSITVTSTGSTANTTIVQEYIDSTYTGVGEVTVPYDRLHPGVSYSFSVRICNFFSKCASSTKQVTKVDTVMPSVKIFGATLRSGRFRPKKISLSGRTAVESCDGDESASSRNASSVISTAWRCYQGGVLQTELVSTSKNPSKFILPAFSLGAGLVYEVQFVGSITSSAGAAARVSTSSTTVYVERSQLVAEVLGGLERNLPSDSSLAIDASGSYDPDQRGVYGVDAGLQFSWACVQLEPMSDSCSVILSTTGDGVLSVLAGANSGGVVSQITMTVKDSDSEIGRSKTKTITVTVLDPLQPVVEMDSSTVRESGGEKISPSSALKIQAEVRLVGTGNCQWTVDDGSFDLSAAAVVSTNRAISRSGYTLLPFVLAPYSLREGTTMTFELTCTQYASAAVYGGSSDDGVDYSQFTDLVGTSSITVEVNSPPSPGQFAVTPPVGTELKDMFSFSSSLWSDDDLPITYQYGFVSTGGRLMPVQSRSESASRSVILPAGDPLEDYVLLCVATIYDSFNANTTMTASVSVNQTSDVASAGMDLLTSLAASSDGSSADVDTVFAAVSVTMSAVNSVNCSAAPNCTLLHRSKCAAAVATCGPCLTGFSGVLGESNIACYNSTSSSSSSSRKRSLNAAEDGGGVLGFGRRMISSTLATGDACVNSDDCEGFETCSTAGLCEMPSKTCPGSYSDKFCSGNGDCVFMKVSSSAAGPSKSLSKCLANNYNCLAYCRCHEGYVGVSCDTTEEEADRKREVRGLAVNSLEIMLNSTGVGENLDDIISTLTSLAEAAQVSTELSLNSTNQLLTMLESLSSAVLDGDVELSYDKVGLFMDVVEKVASLQEQKKNSYISALRDVPTTHHTQLTTLTDVTLVDRPAVYSGITVSGTYRLLYNGTGPGQSEETEPIAADADAETFRSALVGVSALSALVAAGNLTVDVTRNYAATVIDEFTEIYSATYAVPGAYWLTCPNEHTTCGFDKLPPGDLVMIREEVGGPHGDFHGHWYRVHESYQPRFDHSQLPLAEASDASVPTTYSGAVAINGTLLRWARGYSYLVEFSGIALDEDAWAVGPLLVRTEAATAADTTAKLEPLSTPVLSCESLDPPVHVLPNNTGMVQNARIQNLISDCGNMVSKTMVSGQNPYEVVKAGIRMSTTMVSSVEGSTTNDKSMRSLSMPVSESEAALGFASAGTSIPMRVLDASEDAEDVSVTFMSVDASLYELDGDVESEVVFMTMSTVPRYFDESYDVANVTTRTFNVTIPTEHTANYNYPSLPIIKTECGDDDWSVHTYSCEEVVMADPTCASYTNISDFYNMGQWITVACNGSVQTVTSRCDLKYTAPSCDSVGGVDSDTGTSLEASGCEMVAYDATTTTCACPVTSDSSRRRRRLDNATYDSGAVSFNYVALASSVADSFTSTWSSVGDLDGDAVSDGWQVLVVMSSFVVILLFVLMTVHQWDSKDREKASEDGKLVSLKDNGAVAPDPKQTAAGLVVVKRLGAVVQATPLALSKKEKKEKKEAAMKREEDMQEMRLLYGQHKEDAEHWRKVRSHVRNNAVIVGEDEEELAYIEQTLPSVFRSKPLLHRLLEEMKSFHRWFCIIFTYSETFPRTLRVLSMFSNVMVTMLIQALTYNFTDPNDGTCPTYDTSVACLADGSTFDDTVPKCYWVPRTVGGRCHFREPEDTLSIVVFVAVFAAMVSIPMLVSIEWVVKNVLAAKTSHVQHNSSSTLYKDLLEKRATETKAIEEAKRNGGGAPDDGGGYLSTQSIDDGAALDGDRSEMAAGNDSSGGVNPVLMAYARSALFSGRHSQSHTKDENGDYTYDEETAAAGADDGNTVTIQAPLATPASQRQKQRRRSYLMHMLRSTTGASASRAAASQRILTTTLQEDLGTVIVGMRRYRATLTGAALLEFDESWGLTEDAEGRLLLGGREAVVGGLSRLVNRNRGNEEGDRAWLTARTGDGGTKDDVQERMTNDLEDVRATVESDYTLMNGQPSMATDVAKGKHLLSLFQQDLMPGINGQILHSKDTRNQANVVTVDPATKIMGWVMVLTMNLAMLMYVMLFALSQSSARQGAWFRSFFIWFVMEVIGTSTVVCFVTHFLIPSFIAKDLHKAKRRLLDTIRDYNHRLKKALAKQSKNRRQSMDASGSVPPLVDDSKMELSPAVADASGFNAAAHFYASYRLAAQFPHLKESKIIRAFRTPYPKQSYRLKAKDVISSYNAMGTSIGRSVAMVVFHVLGELLQQSSAIQDLVIGLICTGTVGYTMLIHVKLYQIIPVLVCLPAIICAIVFHFIARANDANRKIRQAKTTPIEESASDTDTDSDSDNNSDNEGEGMREGEDTGAVPLTEALLRSMERSRRNAYAANAGDVLQGPKRVQITAGGDDDDAHSAASEDGNLPIRTSAKRGSVGSLASIDTADQFSDLSFDAGSPGMHAPTVGAAHMARHDGSAAAASPMSRADAANGGLDIMKELIDVQEDQLSAAEGKQQRRRSGRDSRRAAGGSSRKLRGLLREGSLDSAKYASVTIDEEDSSVISGSSASLVVQQQAAAALADGDIVSAAALAAGIDLSSEGSSDDTVNPSAMYNVSSSSEEGESEVKKTVAAGGSGVGAMVAVSKFARLMKSNRKSTMRKSVAKAAAKAATNNSSVLAAAGGGGAGKKKAGGSDSGSSGSGGSARLSVRIRSQALSARQSAPGEHDGDPEMTTPPVQRSFRAPLKMAGQLGAQPALAVQTRNAEPISPIRDGASAAGNRLGELQARMTVLEQRHEALQGKAKQPLGVLGAVPPKKPPKIKSITRGLLASGRLGTGGHNKSSSPALDLLDQQQTQKTNTAAATSSDKKQDFAAKVRSTILRPTEYHGHDDLDY
jgi:hypothetical protein